MLLAYVYRSTAEAYDGSGVMFEEDSLQTLVLAPQDLTEYTVPASTVVIAGGDETRSAFINCRNNIQKLYFERGSQLRSVQKYSFYKCAFDDTIDMSVCLNLTVINENAFAYCEKLKYIIFPPFIENIKSGSFMYCYSLLEVKFPKFLTNIGGYQSSTVSAAFYKCNSLRSVTFEVNIKITSLNADLFSHGNLSTFKIPASLKYFTASAIMNNSIHSISVEKNNTAFWTDGIILTNIQKTTIYYCCPLASKIDIIPDSITVLADSAFRYTLLDTLNIPRSITSIKPYCFASSKLKNINVPFNVIELSSCAFRYCYNLTDVNFQANVSLINSDMFANCSRISEITFPVNVHSLSTNIFRYCRNLKHIIFQGEITSIGTGCFAGTHKDLSIEFLKKGSYSILNGLLLNFNQVHLLSCLNKTNKNIVIPSTITSIEEMAFYQCELISIDFTLATKISSLGVGVFQCSYLKNITLPSGINEIPNSAFDSCIHLSTIDFAKAQNITQIGSGAFKNTSIRSIILPQSIIKILDSAFEVESLEFIKLGTNIRLIGNRCFAGSKIKSFIIPISCSSFGEFVFENSFLERLTIDWPSSLNDIGDYSFYNCKKLKYIDFYNNQFQTIGRSSFENCISINQFTLPSSITTIKLNAFKNCSILESIDIPDDSKLEVIEGLAFENCNNLYNFKVNVTNKHFNSTDNALYDKNQTEIIIYLPASNRTKFELPKTVTKIRAYCFQNARNLQEIDVRQCDIDSIGHKAFSGCLNLMSVYLPSSLKSIDSMAFEYCPLLGCGSVSYNGPIKYETLFAGTMIKEEALVPCPTNKFSDIIDQEEITVCINISNLIFVDFDSNFE